jgi:hypothetical protein
MSSGATSRCWNVDIVLLLAFVFCYVRAVAFCFVLRESLYNYKITNVERIFQFGVHEVSKRIYRNFSALIILYVLYHMLIKCKMHPN